jgi:hypothetical protein
MQKLVVLSLVEMGRIVDVFTPNATTQQNSLVKSDLLARTRLKCMLMFIV